MRSVDELRPLTAAKLLTIRREVRAQEDDELVRSALCNARVLAACCYCENEEAFPDGEAVLAELTFPEMETLLRRLADGGNEKSTAQSAAGVNPQFSAARFESLREGRT